MNIRYPFIAFILTVMAAGGLSAQPAADKSITLKQVNDEAKKNNQTTAITTGEMTEAATRAEKEGKFRLAADYYGELIQKDPENIVYYNSRGAIYLNNLKDYKAALKDFDQVIRINAKEPAGFFNRGTAWLNLAEWKKAKKDYDAALALNPAFVEAFLNRGIASLNTKDIDEAIADFERAINLNPRFPNIYRARAIAYKLKGNAALAQADELKAAQLDRGQ